MALRLAPLEAGPAADLFRCLTGVEPDPDDAVLRVVAACGGFPSAVVSAAGRFRVSSGRDLYKFADWLAADPVQRLSTGRGDGPSVARGFMEHLECLGSAARSRFLALAGLDREPFDVGAVHGDLDLSEVECEELLEGLVDACLLEVDCAGQYLMTDLVREAGRFAARRAAPVTFATTVSL